MNFAKRLVIIGGTNYGGEIKKSIFTVMNYLLPLRDIMPMHCSANIGESGDVALFFGLSGTGKTTLSTDPHRGLIGDDEHGWSADGVFNFEGGCYAKMIKLSAEAEPQIYATTRRFGTVLENVVLDPVTRALDLDDASNTENTRGAYPLDFIDNAVPSGRGGHPTNIVMLTADAFGVLPPIARLSPEAAMYHFLSGYTAKVAGTERGVTEPKATFSTCFGAPFMVWDPNVYAKLLGERIAKHQSRVWLVNTGWTGGALRRGLTHENRAHARDDQCRIVRRPRDRARAARPDLQPRRAHQLSRRVGRRPQPAQHVAGQERLRPDGQEAGDDVRRELQDLRSHRVAGRESCRTEGLGQRAKGRGQKYASGNGVTPTMVGCRRPPLRLSSVSKFTRSFGPARKFFAAVATPSVRRPIPTCVRCAWGCPARCR